MEIPFLDFAGMHGDLKKELVHSSEEVLGSGWLVMGRHLREFEAQWVSYERAEHGIGVSNGLDGLVLALRALGVVEGDEVIVPSHTHVASWLAVSHVGATPVPVEGSLETGLSKSRGNTGLVEVATTGFTSNGPVIRLKRTILIKSHA